MDELDQIFSKQPAAPKKRQPPKPAKTGPAYSIRQENNPELAKYTEEGFRIYSTAELKIGQGGRTDQCPFECSCCF